ncbi:hypothetical protein LINGRAHAP2_LOCUS5779 [Linum grandiflorum]
MKKMDIFCKSPSSTAICSSLDHRSMVRHHYHSAPSTPKLTTPIFAPCSSSHDLIPFNPSDNLRRRSTSAVAVTDLYKKPSASDKPKQSTTTSDLLLRRRSSADVADLLRLRHRRHRSHSESSAHLLNHDAPAAAPPPYSNWVSGSAPPDQQTRNKIKLKRSSVYDYAPVREIERRHSSASVDPTHEPKRTGLIGWVRSDSYRKHDAVSEITPAQQAENNNHNNAQLVKSQDCPPVLKSSSSDHPPSDVQVKKQSISKLLHFSLQILRFYDSIIIIRWWS